MMIIIIRITFVSVNIVSVLYILFRCDEEDMRKLLSVKFNIYIKMIKLLSQSENNNNANIYYIDVYIN